MVETTRPGVMEMATPVTHLVMMETLTMAATMTGIVGILLLQMRQGIMLERSNRRKGGYSCNAVETFSLWPGAGNCHLGTCKNGKDKLGSLDFACIRTSSFKGTVHVWRKA